MLNQMKFEIPFVTEVLIGTENRMRMRLPLCNIQNLNLHIRINIVLLSWNTAGNLNSEKLILPSR